MVRIDLNLMPLLLAVILIYGEHLSAWWYPIALVCAVISNYRKQ